MPLTFYIHPVVKTTPQIIVQKETEVTYEFQAWNKTDKKSIYFKLEIVGDALDIVRFVVGGNLVKWVKFQKDVPDTLKAFKKKVTIRVINDDDDPQAAITSLFGKNHLSNGYSRIKILTINL